MLLSLAGVTAGYGGGNVLQGVDLGRPSTLTVGIPAGDGGIRVTGNAVPLPQG